MEFTIQNCIIATNYHVPTICYKSVSLSTQFKNGSKLTEITQMRTTDKWQKQVSQHFLKMPNNFLNFHPGILLHMEKIFKHNSYLLESPISQRYFGNIIIINFRHMVLKPSNYSLTSEMDCWPLSRDGVLNHYSKIIIWVIWQEGGNSHMKALI